MTTARYREAPKIHGHERSPQTPGGCYGLSRRLSWGAGEWDEATGGRIANGDGMMRGAPGDVWIESGSMGGGMRMSGAGGVVMMAAGGEPRPRKAGKKGWNKMDQGRG